ncbi:P-loop containing nucleoside triphosphate hydrolase protein [Suillus placidus]|uniref:P-loop containing nucleoside triphosphate hydrolase protein n=1 Tax=Suillus placidus TaxID=48579 RepID=A0A9P7CY09_9AGAM|nr:P-loop containing nucleoside triphosphate hydrolase protein [Suillus placidus]
MEIKIDSEENGAMCISEIFNHDSMDVAEAGGDHLGDMLQYKLEGDPMEVDEAGGDPMEVDEARGDHLGDMLQYKGDLMDIDDVGGVQEMGDMDVDDALITLANRLDSSTFEVTVRLGAATQVLCLAPSRELARQIMSVVIAMGKFTPVQMEHAIKDNLPKGASQITAHVVVGTPGTMTDLVRRKVIDTSEVKVFVLDEADNMLDQDGLGDQTLRVKK